MHVLVLAFFLICVSCVGGVGGQWSGTIRGHVDTHGDWGVEIGATFHFGKRSTDDKKFFTLRFDVNPCDFNLYDANRDGVITKEELVALFGDNTKTTELFETLDILSGDGKVERDEFLPVMSKTVEGC